MPAHTADIITEWATVKTPPVPELKPVTLDGKTTALLILDMMKSGCTARPRCVATVPNVKKAPRRGARCRRHAVLQLGWRR